MGRSLTATSQREDVTCTPEDVFAAPRPHVRGKFLFRGDEKLYVRGVTYGTFAPLSGWGNYPSLAAVERDFAGMSAAGVNTVRVYTVPPRGILDVAARHGLHVLVGVPWEQHIAFLEDRGRDDEIERRVREQVRPIAGHPALLAIAVGNEIPATIVRYHGARSVERFLARLCRAVREEDPGALVTYVNFPSTEYLSVPEVDFHAVNVYLEQRERFEAYLARLQTLAGDKPLVMAEMGLDSLRNGQVAQAASLRWLIDAAFRGGCAGAFVFAWTDEWHRGGADVEDWDFGLVDRAREPKPALQAVSEAFARVPLAPGPDWPLMSVVICSYNGERTLEDTCHGVLELRYPSHLFEVIVVSDGSTDATANIARLHGFHVIETENRGLSSARNTGARAARGDVVVYLDDDARPDPDWLTYLADAFLRSEHAAIGGPNLPPPGDGAVADCVANAPGGPIHVLLTDQVAEHIPGCNFAVRRDALEAIGWWDEQFRAAGDDVDLCWRLQDSGRTIGFVPAATVWHHRRDSVRTYWKQQRGYGKAEALLERKWPEKYNGAGHVAWAGRLYGPHLPAFGRRSRIYHGVWGSAPFQSVYQSGPTVLGALPATPEWLLGVGALGIVSAFGVLHPTLLLALALLVPALGASLLLAWRGSRTAVFTSGAPRWQLRALTLGLHLAQPVARLRGRLSFGLTPWRRHGGSGLARFGPRVETLWSEEWRSSEDVLEDLERALQADGSLVLRGGDFDRWDLEVRHGLFGRRRLCLGVEEHAGGRILVRARSWPYVPVLAAALCAVPAFFGLAAASIAATTAVAACLVALALAAGLAGHACAAAAATQREALRRLAPHTGGGHRLLAGSPREAVA